MAGKEFNDVNIYLNDNLSRVYHNLLKKAKVKAKLYNYAFVWFQGGKVMPRKK